MSFPSITALTTGYSIRARVEALTNPDMKPSLMSCLFKNASPKSFLILIYADMSISLKVVSIAFVFWASFNLSAILNLILFIATLVSVLVPWIEPGAYLAVVDCTELPPDGGFWPAGGLGGGVGLDWGAAYLGASGAFVGAAASSAGFAAGVAAGADEPLASGSIV